MVRSVTLVKNRGGVGQPVLDKVDLVTLGRYVMLFITHFTEKEKKHGSWANLKGGGQLAARRGMGHRCAGWCPDWGQ